MLLADAIDTAKNLESLPTVGLLIATILGLCAVVTYMYRKQIKHHEDYVDASRSERALLITEKNAAQTLLYTEQRRHEDILASLTRASMDSTKEMVTAVTKNTEALYQNNQLLTASIQQRISGK